ncbi:MAG: alpha/beta hydrolase [Verrucomicrobiales bacterium]|nr:alpha/beta hydrolase [Verrucomicrobiales bacterium]
MNFLKRKWKLLSFLSCIALVVGLAAVWMIGSGLCAACPKVIGDLPADLHGETVEFKSGSGAKLRGWFISGQKSRGAVILMHGVRGNRTGMLGRARFLNAAGHSVLLFDFQAHGESEGQRITFGFLESKDAAAAVEFVRTKLPGEKIAVLGASLGGAAALLADPPLKVDGLILEMVYPTIRQAVSDRLAMKLGPLGRIFTPLLTLQLKLRIDCGPEDLRPIEKVRDLKIPKFFIAGTEDRHTTFSEAQELFQAAAEPKQFWAVEGAGHIDLHGFSQAIYEQRVLEFVATVLK